MQFWTDGHKKNCRTKYWLMKIPSHHCLVLDNRTRCANRFCSKNIEVHTIQKISVLVPGLYGCTLLVHTIQKSNCMDSPVAVGAEEETPQHTECWSELWSSGHW